LPITARLKDGISHHFVQPTTKKVIEMDEETQTIIVIAIIFIAIFAISVLPIIWLYYNSDKVKCNWLWCDFSKTIKNITVSKTCYENGILINCSQITQDER
jgi:hypothetical protein